MTIKEAFSGNSALVEKALILLLLGALGYACLLIVSPFIAPFVWAVILALSTWPYYIEVVGWLGGRRTLAAAILTLALLLVFVVPTIMAFNAVVDNLPSVGTISDQLSNFFAAEPPEWIADVPLLGKQLDADWRHGRLNTLLGPEKIRPALTTTASWLLQQGANLALAAVHVVLATIMAGLLYTHGEKAAAVAERLALRIGGPRTVNVLGIAARTVRGVSLGVIGTALIQAILSGLGFALADVPGAPLLGLACFMAAVMQIGTGVIWIPVALWLAHEGNNGWALFTVAWGIVINTMDNFMKPYFIGKTSALPFLLILVGVIGGLLAWGFIGIFLGTTLLAVAYSVFFDWLDNSATDAG